MTVHDFPSDVAAMLDTLKDMYCEGTIREVIIFAPNARDSGIYHFCASDRIRLVDVLLAKNALDCLARGLSEQPTANRNFPGAA